MENYQVQVRDLLKRAVSEPGTISAAYAEGRVTDSELTPRHLREAEAESVAFLVGSIIGLDNLSDSRGYIQPEFRSSK